MRFMTFPPVWARITLTLAHGTHNTLLFEMVSRGRASY